MSSLVRWPVPQPAKVAGPTSRLVAPPTVVPEVGVTLLTSGGSTTDTTSYTTASVSPVADRVLLLWLHASRTSVEPDTPTVSGNGLTWALHTGATNYYKPTGTAHLKLFVFRAATGASPSSGTISVDFGANTHTGARWDVLSLDDIELGNNGADAIVQVATAANQVDTGLDLSIALAAAADAGNRPVAGFGLNFNNAAIDPRSGWTELSDDAHSTPSEELETQWRSDSFETTASATQTSGTSNLFMGGIALELALVGTGGGGATVTPATIAATAAVVRPLVDVQAGPAVAATAAAVPQPAASVAAGPTAVPAVAALPNASRNVTAGPAVAAAAASLARPLVNVTAGPAVVPVVVALPQVTPTISGDATAQPATVAAVVALPQVTPSASSAVTPATLAAVCALPGVGASVGASPAVLSALVAIQRPLVNVTASPAVLAAVVAVPTPTVGVITVATPATVATVVALAQPAVNVRAGPAVVAAVVALPAPTVVAVTAVAPAGFAAVAAAPAARLHVGAGPAVVAVLVALPQATPIIPPPIPPPRWVEGGAAASGVLEGAATGSGLVEGTLVGAGVVEGGASV